MTLLNFSEWINCGRGDEGIRCSHYRQSLRKNGNRVKGTEGESGAVGAKQKVALPLHFNHSSTCVYIKPGGVGGSGVWGWRTTEPRLQSSDTTPLLHSLRLKRLDTDCSLLDISSRNKVMSPAYKKKKNFLLNGIVAPRVESRCQFKAWWHVGRPAASFSFVISKWRKDTMKRSERVGKWGSLIRNERECEKVSSSAVIPLHLGQPWLDVRECEIAQQIASGGLQLLVIYPRNSEMTSRHTY